MGTERHSRLWVAEAISSVGLSIDSRWCQERYQNYGWANTLIIIGQIKFKHLNLHFKKTGPTIKSDIKIT